MDAMQFQVVWAHEEQHEIKASGRKPVATQLVGALLMEARLTPGISELR